MYQKLVNEKKDILNADGQSCSKIIFDDIGINEENNIVLINNEIECSEVNELDNFSQFQYIRKIKPNLEYSAALKNSDVEKLKLVRLASDNVARETFIENIISFLKENNLIGIDTSNLFKKTNNETIDFYLNQLKNKLQEKLNANGLSIYDVKPYIPETTILSPVNSEEFQSKFFSIKK